MALSVVRSRAVVMLLLIYCLSIYPLSVGFLVFVVSCGSLRSFLFCSHLYLPDTPNTSRRVLRGVRAKMTLISEYNM